MIHPRPAPPLPEGFEPLRLEDDACWSVSPLYVDRAGGRLRMLASHQHCNTSGILHGGAIATFADYQICALITEDEMKDHRVTVNLSLDFVAPSKAGGWIEAQVSLIRRTRQLAFTQAIILAHGEAIARSTAIYRI